MPHRGAPDTGAITAPNRIFPFSIFALPMRPRLRFAIDFLSPTPIAALLFTVGVAITERAPEAVVAFPFVVLLGYVYAILPSLAHALWMRRCYRRGMEPRSLRAAGIMTLSGLLAGSAIGGHIFFAGAGSFALLFPPLGAATGALNALLHRLVGSKHYR